MFNAIILLKRVLETIALPVYDSTNLLNKALSVVIYTYKNSINKFNLIGFLKYLI